MKNGKFAKRRGVATKTLVLVLAVMMIVGISVGGTLAWLTAQTPEVKNTFTPSDIQITLAESENLDLKMVPGCDITKDPKATVLAVSEKCYLFVKIDKSENYDTFLAAYTVADGWTVGDGTNVPSNVIYRVVEDSTADQEFQILEGNKVTVNTSVTKAQMNALTADTNPTLSFTAYAIQYAGFENNVANAWTQASALQTA